MNKTSILKKLRANSAVKINKKIFRIIQTFLLESRTKKSHENAKITA